MAEEDAAGLIRKRDERSHLSPASLCSYLAEVYVVEAGVWSKCRDFHES